MMVVMVVVFRLHALGPSALAADSTTRIAVVAAAVVEPSELDQVVPDQAIDRVPPTNRATQISDRVADGWRWVLVHGLLLSSGLGSRLRTG